MGLNLAEAVALASSKTMRKLGIDTKKTQTWLWPEQKMASDFGELAFKVGQQLPNKVWVVLDGVTHECEGTEVADGNALNFGNEAVNGGENTGEPFWFQFNRNSTNVLFIPINPDNPTTMLDDREYTLGIYTQTETITPIDPKYLPSGSGGGLPVVEFETMPTSEGAELSNADVEKLKFLNGAMPFIAKVFSADGVQFTFVVSGTAFVYDGDIVISAGGSAPLPDGKRTGIAIEVYPGSGLIYATSI